MPQLTGGNHQGFAGVYGMIQAQASMLSFNDIYRVLAIWMVLLIPSFLLLRRVGGGSQRGSLRETPRAGDSSCPDLMRIRASRRTPF